jgi:hypothetical protein
MPATRVRYLDSKVQYGRGKAAGVYGQTYDVYRITNQTGSYMDGPPVFSDFPMSPFKAKKGQTENQTFDLQIFDGTCDNTKLQLGDILVETGFEGEQGDRFVFAQRRPFRGRSLFVRCEANISVTRPQPKGGQAGQQPQSGGIRAPGYIGLTKRGEYGVKLARGNYYFTNQVVAQPLANSPFSGLAAIPAALLQLNRIRDAALPKLPVTLFREHFVIYLPLLNGIQIQELDRLNLQNSDRYETASVYTSEMTGLVGYIAICEKLGT